MSCANTTRHASIRLRPLRRVWLATSLLAALPAFVSTAAPGAADTAPVPGRRDVGDLIVLELAGSYEEMGRQQADLLGDVLRDVYDEQHVAYERRLAAVGGVFDRVLDTLGIPLWSRLGALTDDSSLLDELGGMAAGLDRPRTDLMRALLALGSGSTVFAATRSATVDGQALIGRGVDWDDALGRRRPLLIHYRPTNGDLEHLFAGWPLVGLPTVGVNEAGFALSFNYFVTDPQVGLALPQWPHRRALQTARSVEDGIRIFLDARERGISSFMVMADANGAIAMVECTPKRCAVFRPDGDWFGQANHARTPEMVPFDRYRAPDSFDRRLGMEQAVQRWFGRLTPEAATEILRDRSMHPWPNASNVANLAVLNAAVVHPASRTLWHSTTMQPHAPFGAYLGLSLAKNLPPPRTLPAADWLASDARARELDAITAARRALHAHLEGRFAEAGAGFEALIAETPPRLDPARLAIGAALARGANGEPEAVRRVLRPSLDETAPPDVRIYALLLDAHAADRLGQREDAVRDLRALIAQVEAHPEWNEFARASEQARRGLSHSLVGETPAVSRYVLRIPE